MNTPKAKKWISEFQSLLHKIGLELTEDDLKSMKFLLSPDIGQNALDKAKHATDIFTLMQKSEILSYQNTKRLASVLQEVNRADQATKLREFEKELQQSKSVPYNIRKERLVRHFKKTRASIHLEDLMQKHPVVTISGPLGAGKSQTAISFGTDLQKKNSDSIVWYCSAKDKISLLNSLRSLAEEMSIPTASPLWSDTDDENAIAAIGKELHDQLQSRHVNQLYHLLIIDDVTSACTKTVHSLVQSISTSDEPNIKFLITTRDKYLLKDYGKIDLNGFSVEESLDFLTQGVTMDDERICMYRKLAEAMSNLPLGLYMARTYMENMSIGPEMFLQLLKTENIDGIECQLREMNLQSTEITLFTAMKFCIYQDLKANMKPEVFEMFQMTQFLENEEIPISLLEFVYRESRNGDKSKTLMLSNFLVQALQKRSLGIIEGEDEDRRLSVHSVIVLTLSLCTSYDEKRSLLQKLIWGFALLLDKDVFHNKDLSRMQLLIPHARAFLKHAETFNIAANYDMLVLMTFVYDLVGYGYNYGHFQIVSNEYSEKSKQNCFRIMDWDDTDEIDACTRESCSKFDENNVEFYEILAQQKSEIMWRKLNEAAKSKETILDRLIPRFVLQRFRTKSNMQDLAKRLDVDMSDLCINVETYEQLVNQGLAVSFDCMKLYFLHELLLSVFYTYGRQLFYLGKNPDVKEARKCLSYLFLAKELGQKLSEKQHLLPLNALLSEITGVLQSRIEDDAKVIRNKLGVLQHTAERAEILFSMKGKYHIFGIFKMDASVSTHFQNNCLKLAIRCFTTMLNVEVDEKRKLEIYGKGCKLADEILDRAKEMRDRRDLPGYKVRVAEFYISIENIPTEQLNRAETLFKEVFPRDELEGDFGRACLERHELKAGYGLAKCYELSGRQDSAENLKAKLKAIEM